jgi:hypothetical protein
MPSAAAYAHRFGSLIRAYQTVGFTPDRDYQYLEVNQFLRRLHPEIVGQTERMIAEIGGTVERDPATDLLTVNREFTVSLVLARCQSLDSGRRRWKVRFDTSLAPDITVAVRLDDSNQAALDYYLLPRLDFGHLAQGSDLERARAASLAGRDRRFVGSRELIDDGARCLGLGLPPVRGRHARAARHAVATRGRRAVRPG